MPRSLSAALLDTASMSPHFAIGCFASICRNRLGDQLLGFSERFPDVVIGIHEMPRAALVHALAMGEVAMAVIPGDVDRQFDALRLWRDQTVVALPAGHRLADAPAVDPAALADELFLVSRVEHGWDMHRFLAARVLRDARPATALHDVEEKKLLALVGRGDGVALLCRSHVADGHPSVVLRPVDAPAAQFAVHAHWRRGASDPVSEALLAAIDPDAES